jgi:hypothetical protein
MLAPLAGFPLSSMNWPLLALVIPLAALGFTALGFAMAWWIDSTQGYHAVMSVALIPLWMLSGAMFPPSRHSRWLAVLTAPRSDDLRVSAVRAVPRRRPAPRPGAGTVGRADGSGGGGRLRGGRPCRRPSRSGRRRA